VQKRNLKKYMNKEFNKKILSRIESTAAEPKPSYYFSLREWLLHLGVIVSVVLAAILMGSLVFQFSNTMVLPPKISWLFGFTRLMLIILALVFAVYQIVLTEKGYKQRKRFYVLLSIFTVAILGSLLFFTNLSGDIENRVGTSGFIAQSREYWTQPESGVLAAELQEITNDGYLLMNDFNNQVHVVDIQYIDENMQDLFIDFLRVRMVGYENGNIFYPCAVAPWELHGAPKKEKNGYFLQKDNIQFSQSKRNHDSFKNIFERKNEIMRNNRC
jgi:hypothetical protein